MSKRDPVKRTVKFFLVRFDFWSLTRKYEYDFTFYKAIAFLFGNLSVFCQQILFIHRKLWFWQSNKSYCTRTVELGKLFFALVGLLWKTSWNIFTSKQISLPSFMVFTFIAFMIIIIFPWREIVFQKRKNHISLRFSCRQITQGDNLLGPASQSQKVESSCKLCCATIHKYFLKKGSEKNSEEKK